MNFNSSLYLFFLTIVVALNYISPPRHRTSLLVFASFLFIGYFNIESLFVVLAFSLFNFYLAQTVYNRRSLYAIGLFTNIVAIILFHYFDSGKALFDFSSGNFDPSGFVMILGFSFYSLQNIAYLTDVYYGRIQSEKSVTRFFLYVTFFPKIISGPITTASDFFSQINAQRPESRWIIFGAQLFLFGLFKKMVLADRLSPSVAAVFDGTESYYGLTVLFSAYLFTLQLYFDFSGYTDMALGAARMLGFSLPENFNLPLRSTSISEFWRRWHISLISWFTNYIYYPIVFKLRKHSRLAVFAGIFVTFFVSGIWHGIGLTFLLWALCHIIFIWLERLMATFNIPLSKKLPSLMYQIVSVIVVFNAVCFSNMFFRTHTASRAFELIKSGCLNFTPHNWLADVIAPLAHGGDPMQKFNIMATLLLCGLFLLFEKSLTKYAIKEKINIPYTIIVVLLIMVFGIFNSGEQFIYMQF